MNQAQSGKMLTFLNLVHTSDADGRGDEIPYKPSKTESEEQTTEGFVFFCSVSVLQRLYRLSRLHSPLLSPSLIYNCNYPLFYSVPLKDVTSPASFKCKHFIELVPFSCG